MWVEVLSKMEGGLFYVDTGIQVICIIETCSNKLELSIARKQVTQTVRRLCSIIIYNWHEVHKNEKPENMTPHQTRRVEVFIISGMALVLLTRLVRPHLGIFPSSIVFIFGILPNFGAALSLPFLIYIFIIRFLHIELGNAKHLIYFALAIVIAFLSLSVWEIAQFKLWGYPIDIDDIIATGFGLMVALGGYLALMQIFKTPNQS
jgi:hypothetical protein